MPKSKVITSSSAFGDMASLVKHLPQYDEPGTLILLKGHLLIEELLRGYIDRTLPNPSAFKHRKFLFDKVLMLCRALTPPEAESWVFDAAKKLNEARNAVAHELDSPKHKDTHENFIKVVEQHSKKSGNAAKARREARLYLAIAHLHFELSRTLRAQGS